MIKKILQFILCSAFVCLLWSSNVCFAAEAPEFTIGSAQNVSTNSVVIPVTTKNFVQLMAWQGSINWDNSKLTFESVSAPVSQLSGMQFNPSVSGSDGRLSFIWVDNNLSPKSIADSTTLFTITFNVVAGASGFSDVIFSNSPTQLLVSDSNNSAVKNVVYNNGLIKMAGNFISPEFFIGSAINVSTAQVVIPVTTKNFGQLLGWQGSLAWDTAKLTYAGVSAPHSQLSGIQFNPSITGGKGVLSFVWAENNATPQTINDNDILFSITLNVVNGARGSTDISFSDTPTKLLVSDAHREPVNNIIYHKGNIAFPGAQLPPEFIIGSVYNVTTSTFVVPVTAKNFTDLSGWQGSVNWDNSKITFASVSTPIAKLNEMMFNASSSGGVGRLGFVWANGNSVPQTIPDSTVLFSITFNVLSNTGITDINFTNSPTSLLVSDANAAAMNSVVYTKGSITFSTELCSGETTITSNITGISYQWQVNTGNGFTNLSENANYRGTNTITLHLLNVPSAWSGYQYRCVVNGSYSSVYSLRFRDYINGNSTINWEDLANWSCIQKLPDANTDVIITNGTVLLNFSTTVKSIQISPGANLIIQPGQNLTIVGKQ